MQVEGLESDIAYVTLTQAMDFADCFWDGGGGVREKIFFLQVLGPPKKPGENDAI